MDNLLRIGGASVQDFKLPLLVSEDTAILIGRLCELQYSLETVIEILNDPPKPMRYFVL